MKPSPFLFRLLFDFYALAEDPPNMDYPGVIEATEEFLKMGIIQPSKMEGKKYETSPLGDAWVQMILETPLPEIRFVDPRLDRPKFEWKTLPNTQP